jgi:hypothetical protein
LLVATQVPNPAVYESFDLWAAPGRWENVATEPS